MFYWVYLLFLFLSSSSTKTLKYDFQNQSFRAAIVTLTHGDPLRLLNMLHSIEYFFPQSIDKYSIIIFYDSHGTEIRNSTLDYIKSCVKLRLIFQNIVLFTLIKNPTQTIDIINREVPTIFQRPIGSDYLLPQYLRTYHNNCKSYCFPFQSYDSIYNNCFLTRVQFWYQKIIEKFLNNLLLNDSILIHSLGDGNIHAVIFALTSDTKRSQKIQFTYAHNIHIYGKRNKNFDLQHN
ncbi:unnamed protein product [Rotaria sp. Silwood1]|nr:unnamed protein product [Rotaria sp. Silwood1]CAF1164480.1 unnamed protein product [Rotaria sp. Silwood1]